MATFTCTPPLQLGVPREVLARAWQRQVDLIDALETRLERQCAMKWLCICQYGHSRSVALTRVLHSRKMQAVAVGCGTSPDAIPVLAEWADVIVTLQPTFDRFVPASARHKLVCFDVGPDVWSNPYNQTLLRLLETKLDAYLSKRST